MEEGLHAVGAAMEGAVEGVLHPLASMQSVAHEVSEGLTQMHTDAVAAVASGAAAWGTAGSVAGAAVAEGVGEAADGEMKALPLDMAF